MQKDFQFISFKKTIQEIQSHSNVAKQQNENKSLKFNSQLQKNTKNNEIQKEGRITLKKRERNIQARIINFLPYLKPNHIYNFFGSVVINQLAIQHQNYQESYFHSYFANRVIQRVQICDTAVILQMASTESRTSPPIQYIIDKFKSKGDLKFYQTALLMEELSKTLSQEKPNQSDGKNPKNQSLKKCLDMLGNKMFVCTYAGLKVAISKSLLTYLQYDVEEFAINALKYHTILVYSYSMAIKHVVAMFKNLAELQQKKMTVEECLRLANFHMTDFMLSKSGVKSYCDMTFCLLYPHVFCHLIDNIHYRSDEIALSIKPQQKQRALRSEIQVMRQQQYQLVSRIKRIPASLLKENSSKISGYQTIVCESTSQEPSQLSNENS